jgi:hypothetical protein
MKRLAYWVAVLGVLTACDQTPNATQPENTPQTAPQNTDVTPTEETLVRKHAPDPEWALAELQFDQGKRWKANHETSEAIQAMDDAMDVFLISEEHTLVEFHNFQAMLERKYEHVFEVCTMRGPAHDELHKLLVRVKVFLDKMRDEDPSVVLKAADKLHTQLHIYSIYFE